MKNNSSTKNIQNPHNPLSELYKKLTRLFSGPIVNYRVQLPRNLSKRKLDKFKFRSASGQAFKKTTNNPMDHLYADMMANHNRAIRYEEFNQMEFYPEIATALDIYADEMTSCSGLSKMLEVKCPNEEIKSILEVLYQNVLNLDFNLFGWCRTLCKRGDFILYLDVEDDIGVKNAIPIPPQEIERLEGEDENNPNYIQYQWNAGGLTFENWQIAHFRILGDDKFFPYGTSVLDSARRIWRQLMLIENAVIGYRVIRSTERRVFYIDVGNIPPEEVEPYMQKIMTEMKRNQVVDPNTGQVDLRYSPYSLEDDFYLPVRGDTQSKIDTLAGGSYTGDIEDVEYFRDKLFTALKIPGSYLSNKVAEGEDKTTLAQKDVRFARTIQYLQRVVISELEKIGRLHLYVLGYRSDDLVSFKLSLNNPSKIAEMQELEHWKLKFDIASSATEGFFSKRWIADNIFGLSEDEYIRNQREMFYDRKFDTALEAAAEAAGEAASTVLGGIGNFEEPGPSELAGSEESDLNAPEDLEASSELDLDTQKETEKLQGDEEDNLILSRPAGNRPENRIIRKDAHGNKFSSTPSSKGKWSKLVKHDNRSSSGPRRRNINAQYSKEHAGSSNRNIFQGMTSRLYEKKDGIYGEDAERLIFSNQFEVDLLIESLEKRKNETKT